MHDPRTDVLRTILPVDTTRMKLQQDGEGLVVVTRESFHRELQSIQAEMLKMGSLVEKQIHEAVHFLSTQDLAGAQAVLDKDDIVDQMQIDIEEACMRLIALQQPLASDLRTVVAIFKITTDVERIGDHACNIAELTLRIGEEPLIKPLIDIPIMADKTKAMVRDSLTCFVERDLELAEAVRQADEPVDQLYSQLFDELIGIVLQGGMLATPVKRLTSSLPPAIWSASLTMLRTLPSELCIW